MEIKTKIQLHCFENNQDMSTKKKERKKTSCYAEKNNLIFANPMAFKTPVIPYFQSYS